MNRFSTPLLALCLTATTLVAQAQGGLGRAILEGLGSITLSDAQVAEYSRQGVQQMDAQSPVAGPNDPYTQRLNRIVARHHTISGIPVNYKVYLVKDVNAFAAGDGSVRVFKGLMDIMTDGELIAVIGHEMGHVVNHDTRDAMKSGLRRAAIRDGLASTNGALGRLSRSQLAGIADGLYGAKFSRQQETEADDYSYKFLKSHGYSVLALATSFEKLAKLGGGNTLEVLSSHPDSQKRAARVRDRARRDGLR
ncbi:M48 family metallopeptidase [Fibrella sp. HMF5335]|uniref:M48 family metallopeptidase n=1 Tax=Fibrella rubiginis TaxID=2817060 RepID=A0A939K482_9BACT|nr:M48 family metallopeptidase [Fibrella rubiginis]MBO0940027.1 M48 family metallopeptidase [Fibrella rubiginis]